MLLEEFDKFVLGRDFGIKNSKGGADLDLLGMCGNIQIIARIFIGIYSRLPRTHRNHINPTSVRWSASGVENKSRIIFWFYTCSYKEARKIKLSVRAVIQIALPCRCTGPCKEYVVWADTIFLIYFASRRDNRTAYKLVRCVINVCDTDVFMYSIKIYGRSIKPVFKSSRNIIEVFGTPRPLESRETQAGGTLPKMTSKG